MTRSTRVRASIAAAVVTAAALTPSAADAAGPRQVRTGNCAGVAVWKLKVQQQNRRVAVEFEVDSGRRGERWRVRMFHNGRPMRHTVATTRGLSGSFSMRQLETNRAGVDRFRVRADRIGGGGRCVARARYRGL